MRARCVPAGVFQHVPSVVLVVLLLSYSCFPLCDKAAARGFELEDIDADGDGNIDFQAECRLNCKFVMSGCPMSKTLLLVCQLAAGILHLLRQTERDIRSNTCPSQ